MESSGLADGKVFWLLPAFLLTALSFGSTVAPKINLYSSLACEDYYSERTNLGLPGPLPGGAFPVIDIGQSNPDCHIPEVTFSVPSLTTDSSSSVKPRTRSQPVHRFDFGPDNRPIWRLIRPTRSTTRHHDRPLRDHAQRHYHHNHGKILAQSRS
jgi:hypothetical protein